MASSSHAVVAILVTLFSLQTYVRSDGSDHRFKVGDYVPLYANKVGKFIAAPVKEKKEDLGEVLNGDRLLSAPYKLEFLSEKDSEIACKNHLSKEEERS
ncbi:hypothetical protein Q3G72_001800 [Acer saccharum]|nr:hypothetical protein Q3G72_001800 [Acer saccharum]